MNIRTTTLGYSDRMVNQLMNSQSSMLDLQLKMTTQKNINKPSDNSVAAAQLLVLNKQQNSIETYKTNIATAREQLDMMDSSLASVLDLVQRANELAIEGSNETYSASQLKGLKGEVDQTIQAIVDFANTKYNGQYIFSGNNVAYPAYTVADDGSVVYNGSNSAADSQRKIEIMEGVEVPLNVNGVDIFGYYDNSVPTAPGGTGLFKALSDLSKALGEDPPDVTAISAQIGPIQDGLNTVNNIRTQYGAYSSKRLDMTESYLSDLSMSLSQQKSAIEDLDLVKALTDLNNQTYAYQASMQTMSVALKLSLIDYM